MWHICRMAHQEQVTVGDRGRIVLPASIRSALGLEPGTRMLVSAESDGSLTLRPYRAVAEEGRGMFSELAKGGSLVEELIAERRGEAHREE
jgi:AbrB family looped-hinge helix DNA binding protein